MGLFDFLKKKEKKQDSQVQAPRKEVTGPQADLNLSYSSGIKAQVNFGNVIDKDGKHLQEIHITYLHPGGRFEGKTYLIEPHTIKDSEGNVKYDTKEFYTRLDQMGRHPDVKAMFKKEYVDQVVERDKTDYIGDLAYDSEGKLYRKYDQDFRRKYIEECKKLREEDQEIARQRNEQRIAEAIENAKNNDGYNQPDIRDRRLTPDMLENPSAPDDFSM